ncbi:hypothetical protein DENSPDRAFT_802371, partial [Dentipellis sp. KUC8613]
MSQQSGDESKPFGNEGTDSEEPGVWSHDVRASGRRKTRYMFGVRHNVQRSQYINPDDYEHKYPPDDFRQCLKPNARVWKVYFDEAKMMDDDMVEAWKDTIDVLLVFAGLFSAVVTTFVVQSSQSLKPDYSQVSAMLLTEMVGLQRALSDGVSPSMIPVSQQNATSGFEVALSDKWVNRLWFISLSFSLATALISVLVKQWLQYYVSPISGGSQEKAHVRHFHYTGLEKWHVPVIVGFLPVFMHTALLLFFLGLVLFLVSLDRHTAGMIGFLAMLLGVSYLTTNALPVFFVDCPYKTLISELFSNVWQYFMSCDLYIKSLREIETDVVKQKTSALDMESLVWLYNSSTNPTVSNIVLQALSNINFDVHDMQAFTNLN